MAEATLCVDRKARRVDRATLEMVPVPEAEGRWQPIGHSQVLDLVIGHMEAAEFQITNQSLALSNDDQQSFATLDLESQIVPGVGLAVGLRNSIDKSLSFGVCLGERVFVCSNLQFGADLGQYFRKHTTRIREDLDESLPQVLAKLPQYAEVSAARIRRLQAQIVDPDQARALMLRSAEREIIGWRILPRVLETWETQSGDFAPRTRWSLLNAYTEALKGRQDRFPADAARQTIQLQQFLAV